MQNCQHGAPCFSITDSKNSKNAVLCVRSVTIYIIIYWSCGVRVTMTQYWNLVLCIHLSRSLILYFNNLVRVTVGDNRCPRAHAAKAYGRLRLMGSVLRASKHSWFKIDWFKQYLFQNCHNAHKYNKWIIQGSVKKSKTAYMNVFPALLFIIPSLLV